MMTKLKCLFLKSLKPLFIISLISCFTLLGNSFVNAGYNEFNSFGTQFQLASKNPYGVFDEFYRDNYCTVNSDLSFSCSTTNNVLVQWEGHTQITTAFYRTLDGLAYISRQIGTCSNGYNDSIYGNYQGIFTGFTLCEGEFSSPYSCSGNQVLSYSDFSYYISSHGVNGFSFSTDYGYLGVCFIGNGYYFCSSVDNIYDGVYFGNFWKVGLNIPYGSSCSYGFTGSYYTMDFNGVLNSPWGGSSSGNFTPGPSTEYKPCMTLKEILALRPQYNTGLCYSSDRIFSGTSFVSIIPKSIFELFPTFNDFDSSLNSFWNYCGNSVVLQNQCSLAFSGKEAEFTLVSKLPNNVKRQDLYKYCDLALNYDLNTSSCVVSGGFNALNPRTDIGGDDFTNGILFPNNPSIPTITSGSALDYLWGVYHSGDFTDFISDPDVLEKVGNDVFNIFPTGGIRNDFLGILPKYIIVGFLGILILYFVRR